MLKRLQDLLFPATDAPALESKDRVSLATCVVLLEAARCDGKFTEEECHHILDVMHTRFEFTEEEAADLMREATEAREESVDLWHFTHEINKAFSPEEKVAIIEEVWRLFYSDDTLTGDEDYLAHKLRSLFNLDHNQFIEAKMKVLKEFRGE